MAYLPYAGIGSRKTPEAALRLMWSMGATKRQRRPEAVLDERKRVRGCFER